MLTTASETMKILCNVRLDISLFTLAPFLCCMHPLSGFLYEDCWKVAFGFFISKYQKSFVGNNSIIFVLNPSFLQAMYLM